MPLSCGHQIVSGEIHYPRIPPEYWAARLAMARAMGLNAISTYVFWNCHEPRPNEFDFSTQNDVARFIHLAANEGLDVILRPGPYVCAEWDFGGLPAWLLADPQMRIRTVDEAFMSSVRRWFNRLGKELDAQLRGEGPIIAVQVENEYGAYGADRAYMRAIADLLDDCGFGDVPMFTIDQPADLGRGHLDDLPIAVTFAPGDPAVHLRQVRTLRPGAPLLCGEYWAGWFDHWGEPRSQLAELAQIRDLRRMLAQGVSLNIYMFHGGTNFGFRNGANAFAPYGYQPTVTSYDYQAALDEAGRPTPKFWAFREAIEAHTKRVAPRVPRSAPLLRLEPFELRESAQLLDVLGASVHSASPRSMEEIGQDYGFLVYRTQLPHATSGTLQVEGLADYALIVVNGRTVAHFDRRGGACELDALWPALGTLDVIVENCGRVNYGRSLPEQRKGILGDVSLDGRTLTGWTMFPVPLQPLAVPVWHSTLPQLAPAFYRATPRIDQPADTFLNVEDVGKGAVWVNGRNIGRCWNIGPQRALYVPGVWLRAGVNEIVVLDLFARGRFPTLSTARSAFEECATATA